jgi:hypothetical protein
VKLILSDKEKDVAIFISMALIYLVLGGAIGYSYCEYVNSKIVIGLYEDSYGMELKTDYGVYIGTNGHGLDQGMHMIMDALDPTIVRGYQLEGAYDSGEIAKLIEKRGK